jgi:hypothetical protein
MKKVAQLSLLLLTTSCAYAAVPGCVESLARAKKDLKVAGSNQEVDPKPARVGTNEKSSLKNIGWYLGTGGVSVLVLGVSYKIFKYVQQQRLVPGTSAARSVNEPKGRSEGCSCGETCPCGEDCRC